LLTAKVFKVGDDGGATLAVVATGDVAIVVDATDDVAIVVDATGDADATVADVTGGAELDDVAIVGDVGDGDELKRVSKVYQAA